MTRRPPLSLRWLLYAFVFVLLELVAQPSFATAPSPIAYVNSIPDNTQIIDVRAISECKKSTLASASCLPIEELLATRQRLANFSGLLWKLGTIGLNGSEHVLIVGNSTTRKDAMGGILYLAGQHKISILEPSITDLDSSAWVFTKGVVAPPTRTQVWQKLMRSESIVLHNEMMRLVHEGNSLILDGRTDAEYWGQIIKAHRGGHIPGADSSSYTHWLASSGHAQSKPPIDTFIADQPGIVYAADTFTGISYYTRVIAAGFNARLYLDGWVHWAAQTDLPVDAVSYSNPNASPTTTSAQSDTKDSSRQRFSPHNLAWPIWALSVAIAFISGYIISRFSKRKS